MDNVFKYFNGFFKGLTGLIITILGLVVAAQILFGMEDMANMGLDAIGGIKEIVTMLGENGFVGLITLLLLFSLLTSK